MVVTITDVKFVGLCRKHDKNKEYHKHKEEDIFCIDCSMNGDGEE